MNHKIFLPFLLILGFLITPPVHAQGEEVGNIIVHQISKGNARELSKYLNLTVQLSLPGNEGRFSRTQAELIIRDFFLRYPPKSFAISHQGSSSDGSRYFIGVYKTGNTSFRSYYLLRQVADQELIHQLRFEDDD